MRNPKLTQLEGELTRIPGITGARVVGEEEPSEIHVVARSDRAPKQIVRDVQSLCAANFSMPIDHRIISVVQLDEDSERAIAAGNGRPTERPVIDGIVVATKGESGWVKVVLRWPDGSTTEGAGAAAPNRQARARGATLAVLKALEPALERKNARVEVEHVAVNQGGALTSVQVHAQLFEGTKATPLVGSAIIHDDIAHAAVRAVLQALNRKIA